VLFNYDWLHAKLSALSLQDILTDFEQAVQQKIGVSASTAADVALLACALRVGGAHVNENPNTLAYDLIGRLLYYYDSNEHAGDYD